MEVAEAVQEAPSEVVEPKIAAPVVSPEAESAPAAYEAPEVTDELPEKKKEEPEAAPADDLSAIDESALKLAERYGFTADEAKAYGSRDNLDRTLMAMDKQAAKLVREQVKAWEQEAQQPRDANGQFVPKPAEQPKPVVPEGYKKYEIPLKPEDWDEETIKTLTGLNDHYDKAYREQHERLDLQEKLLQAIGERVVQSSGQSQADESQQLTTEMDSFFDGLGDEFKGTFGKGPGRLLTPNGQELVSRNQLVEEMRVLDIADAQFNRPRQTYGELAQRALRSLHYDKIKTSARKEVEGKLQRRQKQQIARPSGHNGKAPSNRDVALKRVEEFYKERGFRMSDWDDEIPEV